jgi:flagellar motility protein MotE (MotC chaperone)
MNRQQFFLWMNNPAALDAGSLDDLQRLAIDYPYFQTARILRLLNLRVLQDYRFEQELRQVAAVTADRSRLREWLVKLEESTDSGSSLANKEDSLLQSPLNITEDNHLRALEEQIKASLKEIELKKSQLKELIEEKKAIIGESGQPVEDSPAREKALPLRPLPKDEWLEEFLVQSQNRSPNRTTFYSPEESARRSLEENDGILSETLARLIAAQGKKDKAIKIYQQLMLKNPQKSSYFAAQIEKLLKES